ncbi:MAG: hypothetical protein V2A76_06375 [Planctomycetota bacterium]
MRNRRIRILHEGHEFYLVDRGNASSSRAITILKRAEKEEAEGSSAARILTDLGDCLAIANWTEGEVRMEAGHEKLGPVFQEIVERYLEEFRVGKQTADTRQYFFLSCDGLPLHALAKAQPAGLSVLVFSSSEEAGAAAKSREEQTGTPVKTEAIGALRDFLAARATEGLAGGLLDGRDPIYFCSNEQGEPGYLRVVLNEAEGSLDYSILGADGLFGPYEGEEELTPELAQDLFDQYRVERLGEIPFLGYDGSACFHTLANVQDPEVPAAIELSEDLGSAGWPFTPLFPDPELAREFLVEHGLVDHLTVPVRDLRGLADIAAEDGRLLLLQPGGHRAVSGALWGKGGTVILDSFSGLWHSRDGKRFFRE